MPPSSPHPSHLKLGRGLGNPLEPADRLRETDARDQ